MLDSWYLDNLVCPRDWGALGLKSNQLHCRNGHRYPVVDGIPVMLLKEATQTLPVAELSLQAAQRVVHECSAQTEQGVVNAHAADSTAQKAPRANPGVLLYLESIGLSQEEQQAIARLAESSQTEIDPVVSYLVGATNGIAYRHLLGRLDSYPIPHLRLPDGQGKTLLDIGCNWGRWSFAAARKNYRAIGIDPSLGAVMAARRVAKQLGLSAHFIVADARYLPFPQGAIDTVFSYSVLQHFSHEDAARAFDEIGRVLVPGGTSLIQMPVRWGIRCLYHQARRRFKKPEGFEVRYYTRSELKKLGARVGATRFSVDCYFGIGLQPTDIHRMPPTTRFAIMLSEILRRASHAVSILGRLADSVYLTSTKEALQHGVVLRHAAVQAVPSVL